MKKSTVIGTFQGKCCDSTVFNNNEMFLSSELFNNLFNSEEYKRAIENRYYIGFLGHPEDPGCMDFEHACIVMTECHMEPNGEIFGTFDLVDTPVGRVVKAFIDAGVVFGISIRGAGDLDGQGNVDPDTFVFRGFDLVTFPAYDDAVPVFTEIAASTDLDSQVKYKKVCATINKNLKAIKSSTALDEIKAQFNENSDEYKLVDDRISELGDDLDDVTDEDNPDDSIMGQRVAGMTNLYLEQVEANSKLKKELAKCKKLLAATQRTSARKIATLRRITSSQIVDLTKELDDTNDRYTISVRASKQLKAESSKLSAELEQLKRDNLKYTHKIEANSQIISERDATISDLETKLRKTVTASSKVEDRASNLDEEVSRLSARVQAAEQMVLDYQQAYANMYANALGVHLQNLQITASTTVPELQKLISSGTSTANISAAPYVEDIDAMEIADDDITYSAEMVTL